MPNAADDDSQAGDSDTEDPMKMLEESQAASKRQMEDEDMLADLRWVKLNPVCTPLFEMTEGLI